MSELHLKQPGFTYTAFQPFAKNREITKRFKETGDLNYIYKNKLDRACFPHDTVDVDGKDLTKRTV